MIFLNNFVEKKFVKINQQRLSEIMDKYLFKNECDGIVLNLKIFKVFHGLEKISVEFDMFFKPKLDETFFELFLTELKELDGNNDGLEIELNKIQYDEDILNKYILKYKDLKWNVEEIGSRKKKILSINKCVSNN